MILAACVLAVPNTAVAQTTARFQITIFQPELLGQQSALLLDTTTGETWMLAEEVGPDGKPSTRLGWFALGRSNTPTPNLPRPAGPTTPR